MSDPKEPTIRLSSCRGDGRCPECGEGSAFPFRLLCGCSPCLSSACSLNHTRALLTEALRRNSNEYMRGVEAVLRIRCMKHRLVPELNSVVHGGGECAVCAVENLREERDAAIRERNALEAVLVRIRAALGLSDDAMGWHMIEWAERLSQIQQEHVVALQERDEAIRELDSYRQDVRLECRGLREQAEKAERERDEARVEVQTLRLLVESQTEQVSRSAMDLYSAVQSEVAAEGRADRAEALLRDALVFVECYRDVMAQREAEYPVAKAQALLAKIRAHLGDAK